jgi:Ca2+-transporting ATPase
MPKKVVLTIFLKAISKSTHLHSSWCKRWSHSVLQEWVECHRGDDLRCWSMLVLGFFREYHAENTLEKLSGFIKDRARVIRDGVEHEVDSEELFPGDIIKVSYGSRVPADARILSTNNIYVDEAILTGESKPIQKNVTTVPVSATVAERMNMLHAGTLVVDGFATAVVVATGVHTEIGKIAGLVSGTKQAKTPIQKGLEKISWIIFAIVLVIVVGIFILGIYRGEPLFDMLISVCGGCGRCGA